MSHQTKVLQEGKQLEQAQHAQIQELEVEPTAKDKVLEQALTAAKNSQGDLDKALKATMKTQLELDKALEAAKHAQAEKERAVKAQETSIRALKTKEDEIKDLLK